MGPNVEGVEGKIYSRVKGSDVDRLSDIYQQELSVTVAPEKLARIREIVGLKSGDGTDYEKLMEEVPEAREDLLWHRGNRALTTEDFDTAVRDGESLHLASSSTSSTVRGLRLQIEGKRMRGDGRDGVVTVLEELGRVPGFAFKAKREIAELE